MSYGIAINFAGHTDAPHNDAVLAAVEKCIDALTDIAGGSGAVQAYSWENNGPKVEVGTTASPRYITSKNLPPVAKNLPPVA